MIKNYLQIRMFGKSLLVFVQEESGYSSYIAEVIKYINKHFKGACFIIESSFLKNSKI